MRTELRLPFALSIALSTTMACGQLVFVPDVDFRAALNAWMPGAVDVNGYIDTQNPDVANVDTMGLLIDWSPADLSGIEAFSGLVELYLNGPYMDPQTLQLNTLPVGLGIVELRFFNIATLPPWPTTLGELGLYSIGLCDQIPPFPASLQYLGIHDCPDLLNVPAFPQLYSLQVGALPLVSALPSLPATLASLYLSDLPVSFVLPDYSSVAGLQEVGISGMMVDSLFPWPEGITGLGLQLLPNLTELPPFPDSLTYLTIESLSALTCIPALPEALELLVIDYDASGFGWPWTTATCLPNLPSQLGQFSSVLLNGIWYPSDDVSAVCNVLDSACSSANAAVLGTTYWDQNANGAMDVGEPGLSGIQLVATPGPFVTGSITNGSYELSLQPAAYMVTPSSNYPYVASITPSSLTITPQSSTDVLPGNDFGITFMPNVQDLVAAFTSDVARPGFNTTCWAGYRNYGTQVQDGSLSFTYDPFMSFVSSDVQPDVVNGNTLTWNFTQLQPGEYQSINMVLHLSPSAIIGSAISHTVVADPLATDQAPADNTYAYTDVVVGSFDPNDKAVEPDQLTPTQVAAGERVNYTIRFQNTGTYLAERVVITDTLSSDLQWGTMQLVASSHEHSWYIGNGVLHVIFENIMLPDSTSDEPNSHGFVKFSMQPVSSLLLGAAVDNIANIYFDYNEPVITNTATFIVDDNVGMKEVTGSGVYVYPNPVSDVLTIMSETAFTKTPIDIIDVTGRTVLRGTVSGQRATLDIAHLPAGIYRVVIMDGGGIRIVKQ